MHVHEDQFEWLLTCQLQALKPVYRSIDLMPIVGQDLQKKLADYGIVIHHQNSHESPLKPSSFRTGLVSGRTTAFRYPPTVSFFWSWQAETTSPVLTGRMTVKVVPPPTLLLTFISPP
jgi:hypothetical protein